MECRDAGFFVFWTYNNVVIDIPLHIRKAKLEAEELAFVNAYKKNVEKKNVEKNILVSLPGDNFSI